MRPSSKIALGVGLLVVALGIAAGRLQSLQGERSAGDAPPRPAPEFVGIDRWLNGGPLTMEQLRGDVVLIDFWTYSCVNCVRTFDSLKSLHERYADAGLRIVGVHSPEFDFEKDPQRVEAAIERHGLPYPVAMDNEMETWRAYRNNYWPHVYLVDAAGRITFDHIGEGGEDEIERKVRELLEPLDGALPPPIRASAADPPPRGITPEIYAGFERGGVQGSLGNLAGFRPQEDFDYGSVEPNEVERAGTEGIFFLEGGWRAEAEYVEASSASARVVLRFRARDVFMVAGGGSRPTPVAVLLDGERVEIDGYRGQPSDEQVVVATPDLYRLIALDGVETHTLTLHVQPGFRLYTFTFG